MGHSCDTLVLFGFFTTLVLAIHYHPTFFSYADFSFSRVYKNINPNTKNPPIIEKALK